MPTMNTGSSSPSCAAARLPPSNRDGVMPTLDQIFMAEGGQSRTNLRSIGAAGSVAESTTKRNRLMLDLVAIIDEALEISALGREDDERDVQQDCSTESSLPS